MPGRKNGPDLRLLILLSALIAGLTGIIAGEPVTARPREPAAVAAVLSGAVEPSREAAVGKEALPAFGTAPAAGSVRREPAPAPHKADERRLE